MLFIQKWVIILSNGFACSVSGHAQLAVIQNSLAHKPTLFFCHLLPNDVKDRFFKRSFWALILLLCDRNAGRVNTITGLYDETWTKIWTIKRFYRRCVNMHIVFEFSVSYCVRKGKRTEILYSLLCYFADM